MRLDMAVANRKNCSREYAKSLILSRLVRVDGVEAVKPGMQVNSDAQLLIEEPENRFVGRGGLKLHEAIAHFSIDLTGQVCLDVGASTGGFTHCMLVSGAKKVFAIDVGTGQLAESLLNNPAVVNLEKTNINAVTPEVLGEKCSFAAVDVSFVSLAKVLPGVLRHIAENGELVCLVKPQFEAGREYLNKRGIVKDIKAHKRVLKSTCELYRSLDLSINGLIPSPIRGGDGNREYLLYGIRGGTGYSESEIFEIIQSV